MGVYISSESGCVRVCAYFFSGGDITIPMDESVDERVPTGAVGRSPRYIDRVGLRRSTSETLLWISEVCFLVIVISCSCL